MLCWNCGNELTEDADSCPQCGAPAANKTDMVQEPPEEPAADNADPPSDPGVDGENIVLRKNLVCTVSLLLAVIFACGALASGYLGVKSVISLITPYRQEQAEQMKNTLEYLEYCKDTALQDLEISLKDVHEETGFLEVLLAEYQGRQRKELLANAAENLDLEQIFSEDFFTDAFEQYLTDLLNAFKNDEKLNEWLYPYYTFTVGIGENQYINEKRNLDMWFYEMPGNGDKFTSDMKDGETFLKNVSEFKLYDLIYYYGRIYLSASDLMNLIFKMPNYVADSAVLVRAYGGNPDPEKMSVPGWNSSDYINFWYDAEKYITRDFPIWTYYNLSTRDFNLKWNDLTDEQTYYDAYVKFMDAIAPGLSVYNMVSYYASDDAYGGMGFDITGKEAAPTEIALLYLENHPETIELLELDTPTSYDGRIADTRNQLEQLRLQEEKLISEKKTLSEYIAENDSLYDEYEALLNDIHKHKIGLLKNILLFCAIAVLLCPVTLFSICLFIRLLKQPDVWWH